MIPNVTDERLCWLTVREELGKWARGMGPLGRLTVLGSSRRGGARLGGDVRRQAGSDRMRLYGRAVDHAAQTLSAGERKHLRATGEVPGWFLADVERRYQEIRKRRR